MRKKKEERKTVTLAKQRHKSLKVLAAKFDMTLENLIDESVYEYLQEHSQPK